jgi:hypothetical protein
MPMGPNFVRFFDLVSAFSSWRNLYLSDGPVMIFELCSGPTVREWLEDVQMEVNDDSLSQIRKFALDIGQGMMYLSEHKVGVTGVPCHNIRSFKYRIRNSCKLRSNDMGLYFFFWNFFRVKCKNAKHFMSYAKHFMSYFHSWLANTHSALLWLKF